MICKMGRDFDNFLALFPCLVFVTRFGFNYPQTVAHVFQERIKWQPPPDPDDKDIQSPESPRIQLPVNTHIVLIFTLFMLIIPTS